MGASRPQQTGGYYRQIGGAVERFAGNRSRNVRVESFTRKADEPILWKSRQPCLSMIWWKGGFEHFDVDIEGQKEQVHAPKRTILGVVPPDFQATGEFHAQTLCEYDIVFIENDFVSQRAREVLERKVIGEDDLFLQGSLAELIHWKDDATFPLMAEGWALQTIARLQHLHRELEPAEAECRTLDPATIRRLEDFIRSHLHGSIGLTELADIAGMSLRHFARSFKTVVGQTPARFVHGQRIELAKELLSQGEASVTEIALACGFSHSQHFSNSFRRATRVSPSGYRHRRRS